MSTDLQVRGDAALEEAKEFVRNIKDTTFVKGNLRGKPYEILACVLAGRELGMGPMESLREIDVIDGRPSLSAKGMQGLAVARGHKIDGTIGPDSVTVVGIRVDNGATLTVTWTTEMAKRAGLLSKKTWQQYPEAMLWNRAVSQLCRSLFPDVLTAVKYEIDEMEFTAEDRVADVFADLPVLDADEVLVGEVVDEEPDLGEHGSDGSQQPGEDSVPAKPGSEPASGEGEQSSFEEMLPESVKRGRSKGPDA